MKRGVWYSPRNLLPPLIGGIGLTVTPMELWLLAWIFRTACYHYESALVQLAVVIAILLGAFFAPVKYADSVCNQSIQLPKTSLTVGELERLTGWHAGATSSPVRIDWRTKRELKSQTVELPREELLVRDLIAAVEAQTRLRHRFAGGCANGSTILVGVPPGFLVFRDPEHPYEFDDDQDTSVGAPLSPTDASR